jgi:hypothetical protein
MQILSKGAIFLLKQATTVVRHWTDPSRGEVMRLALSNRAKIFLGANSLSISPVAKLRHVFGAK